MAVTPNLSLRGIDYDWLGVDHDNNLAVFVTAGEGPMPVSLFSRLSENNALLQYIEDMAAIRGKAQMEVKLPRPDDFIRYAQKGFYTYDWSDMHRTAKNETNRYERMSLPQSPIKLNALPAEFQELVRIATMPELSFETSKQIDVFSRLDCVRTDGRNG